MNLGLGCSSNQLLELTASHRHIASEQLQVIELVGFAVSQVGQSEDHVDDHSQDLVFAASGFQTLKLREHTHSWLDPFLIGFW